MAGKTYSAGTIFLQVVPVFGDVQRTIASEAKDWNKALGDEMEKGGQTAGERAAKAMGTEFEKGSKEGAKKAASSFEVEFRKSLSDMEKSLKPIRPKFEGAEVRDSIKLLIEDFDKLKKASESSLTPTRYRKAAESLRQMQAHAHALYGDMEDLNKQDFKRFLSGLDTVLGRMESVRKAAEIEVRFDPKMADRALGAYEKRMRETARRAAAYIGDSMDPALRKIRKELEDLADTEIGIDMDDATFHRKMDDIERRVRHLSLTSVDIETKVNAGKTFAELAALRKAVEALDGRKINIISRLFATDGPEAAANAFRSFNIRVLGAVTLLPALIPLIAAAGGALLGLIPILASVGAGFGAMLVGFSGIGDAVSALGDQADDAAKETSSAAKTMRSASYAVADAKQALADAERSAGQAGADAARQVADARRAAADAIEDAIDRQRDAQEAYRDSVDDVREAEADLRDARKRAAEEQAAASDDVKDRIRQNNLEIREAVLGAFDATNTFNAVMADGSSTAYDKEAAEVAMLQARERLHELREENKELGKEQKKQRREGVKDSAAVESAQDALIAALERQRDAQEDVGDAAEAVAEARIEGARRVADAVRSQQRTEADGARSIARAQEQLRRANEAYGQALYETGEIGSASAQKVEEAMSKLGPAGQRFALFLFSLRDEFFAFRDAIQTAMLPAVERALRSLITTYGPQFTAFMAEMGGVTGQFFERLAASLEGPAWRTFFATMERLGPKMAAEFGQTTLNWFEAFASILTAVAPFAERMSEGMLKMSEAVAAWAASKEGQKVITDFMEYVERIGPMVLDFLGAFVEAAINLGIALAPWAGTMLQGLTGILEWIAEMDPSKLGAIVASILTIVIAWQAAVGATAAFFAGASAFQTLAGRLIFGALGIAGVLIILAHESETVREVLGKVFDFISDHQETLTKMAGGVMAVVLAMRAWRKITLIMTGLQAGYAAATAGAAGATALQGGAATFAYKATKTWTGIAKVASKAAVALRWANVLLGGSWLIAMGPIGWVILAVLAVAGVLVYLWKTNETFRRIVTKAWEKVKAAATTVFEGIAKVAKWLWNKALKPTFKWISEAFAKMVRGMKLVWKNILWPIFDLIGTVARKLGRVILKGVFDFVEWAWRKMVQGMKWVWQNILKPLWDGIARAAKWLWEKAIRPVWNAIKKGWDWLAKGIKEAWEKWGDPIFDKIKDRILPKLESAFETTVRTIKDIWNGLKEVIGKPIKFVIEDVINGGLIKGFNKIAKWAGSDEMTPLPVPEWGFATGGVLPGYTPGRDVHHFVSPTGGRLHLSGGEAVMRPEFTETVGSGWVERMNAAARAGGRAGVRKAMGFARGGVIPAPGSWNQHTSGYPWATWSGDINVPGSGDYGNPVKAYKAGVVAAVQSLTSSYGKHIRINHPDGSQTLYAHLSEFGVGAGQKVSAGQLIGRVGSTGNSSGPHLHFEIKNGHDFSAPSGESAGSGLPGWLERIVGKPIDWARGIFDKGFGLIEDRLGDSRFLGTLYGLGKTLIAPIVDKISSWFKGDEDEYRNGAPEADLPMGQIQRAVQSVAASYGWASGEQWSALYELVRRESSWNPDADNPTSTAAGLFQKMTSIHGPLEGTIAGQARWGLEYIRARYGNPLNALYSHDMKGWYADGGIIGQESSGGLPDNGTMMYDSGGYLPPGLTTVVNLTGKPEPVFTADQFANMSKGGGAPLVGSYSPVFQGADLDAADVMDEFEFAIRKLSRNSGGRYEGVQS